MKKKAFHLVCKFLVWALLIGFALAWGYSAVFAQEDGATLVSLSISGANSVNENTSSTYRAVARFSNGTSRTVTSIATWSDNSRYATISGGVLHTGSVNNNQSVIVKARYSYGEVTRTANKLVTIVNVSNTKTLSRLTVTGASSVNEGTTSSYTATAAFKDGSTQNVTSSAAWSVNSSAATISSSGVLTAGQVTANQSVTVTASYTSGGVTRSGTETVTITDANPAGTAKSITSTSQNRDTLPASPVPEQTFATQSGFQIFSVNDLGMHCGDLDHRVASILPPFNVLHSLVIQKGTSAAVPEILTPSTVEVAYSAAANPKDPALQKTPAAPIYKTNFWDPNPAQPLTSLAFDGYNPFYPPSTLSLFSVDKDMGLPAPDLALLYPTSGAGQLVASQQDMPGISDPYSANAPQSFKRFDIDFPFFVNFPFGYRQASMNWFAADGIPIAPFDDFGRSNSFPLLRVQAKTKNTSLTGKAGDVLASVDSVVPVSAEASCLTCHTSSVDGGNGQAACIPGVDANCATQGSFRSGTAFIVARSSDDTASVPAEAKREWAADNNIIRLHDAKNGTHLQASTPVVCQTCHYTPALDLAHVGPLGQGDASANGRDQKVHHTNSRALHSFHAQFTDLFANDMPAPNNGQRMDPITGKPTVNTFVQNKLNQSCYLCHPGKNTQCLRGTMFNGGLVCQDCHGGMQQVGNDFSLKFSAATPFPAGADLTKRVPWANMPACQSCHTGDAVSNLGLSDPNVIPSSDGIRLLQAYRTNDTANATPIVATNKRFAEETASNGNSVLYRLSKGHSGVFCEACHGSTHAEWPVQPESGIYIANDNMAATQLQGYTGKITECSVCHTAGTLPVSLGGPHGIHPVGDSNFVSKHEDLVSRNRAQCQACHGQTGQGTVLSKVAVNRTIGSRTLTKGQLVSCNTCHSNPL
jgi:hypothetical protein